MIRLIVSDVDGTLAPDGAHKVNPELFDVIEKLKKKGILFSVASGRQLPSIKKLFAPVSNNVIYIAENGAYVTCRDTEMSVSPMNRTLVENLVQQMRQQEDCLFTMSGREATYIETRDEDFVDLLVNGYKNEIKIVDDVLAVDTKVIKLALYKKNGIIELADSSFFT